MGSYLIKNATLVDGNTCESGVNVLIENEFIKKISNEDIVVDATTQVIDATGKLLLPGVIDDHVHFRDPGLTHKADMLSETRAALAGGVTSFMDMPNTKPQTTSLIEWENKMAIAQQKALVNYAFYIGATNENLQELKQADFSKIPGVKLFMGSSTGNMLVDDERSLDKIFSEIKTIIAVHCEDEQTIRKNLAIYKEKYGDEIPFSCHPNIRSEEACYKSTSYAVDLAKKHHARLHVMHLTTEKELPFFTESEDITAETCVNYLWFDDRAYDKRKGFVKCNPAIKKESDKLALRKAVADGIIKVVATDHAPHLREEKEGNYVHSMSGCPTIQFSLLVMLELAKQGCFSYSKVAEVMCNNPASLFEIDKRGFVRENYYADLVLIDKNAQTVVTEDVILSKCGWSPFEGEQFSHKVTHTFVNGFLSYENGIVNESSHAQALKFNR